MPNARIIENEILIYPNPTSGIVNIVGNEFSINLYNLMGELIISGDDLTLIDISAYSPGIYTLQILYKNKLIIKRIIKN